MKKFLPLLAALPAVALAAGALTELKKLEGSDDRGTFRISYVQLTEAFPNAQVRAEVNKQIKSVAEEFICEANPENHENMSSNLLMETSYATDKLLGISYTTDYFCNGAYPDHTPMSHIFSLKSGKELEVEAEAADSAKLRDFVAARASANQPQGEERNEECADFYGQEELRNQGFVYVLKPGVLQVTPDYPHVIQACGYDTEIPLAELKPLLKKDSDLHLAD